MDTDGNYQLTGKSMIWRNSLLDFPKNVIIEIMSRLPLKTLLVCRCVCKDLNNLASPSSYFNSLYSPRATHALVLRFLDDLFEPTRCLRMLDPEADLARGLDFSTVFRFNIPKVSVQFGLTLRNSCNGLLHLAGGFNIHPNSIILNPLTNEYITLPYWDIDGGKIIRIQLQLLGFAASSNRYKVMRVFWVSMDKPFGVQVHEVGSGLWRDVEAGPFLGPLGCFSSYPNATYLNDTAYVIRYLQGSTVLFYFDFDKEEIGEIELPMLQSPLQSRTASSGVLRERLCVCINIQRGYFDCERVDLWVMRNEGSEGDLWSKKFSIDLPLGPMFGSPFYHVRLIRVLGNGEILMFCSGHGLFCFNPHNNSLRIVGPRLGRVKPLLEPVSFIPSFVPLKEHLSIEQAMVQRVSSSPRDG